MITRKPLHFICLLVSVLLASCAADNDVSTLTSTGYGTWMAHVSASKDSVDADATTRAVFYGGNSGTRYYQLWDAGDDAIVYKGSTNVGTLTPNSYGHTDSELTGALTGTFSVGDALSLYINGKDFVYSGQKGSIGDMSNNFAYLTASTEVSEIDGSGGYVGMSKASFAHQQAYAKFVLTNEDGTQRLHPSSLTVYAASNNLVESQPLGGAAVYAPLTINTVKENGEYPGEVFVALRNDKATADTYTFRAQVGDDVYFGPADRALTYKFPNGVLAIVVRAMKLTTDFSTLVADPIPSRHYTGSAYEPTGLTIRDDATVLTEGTDYAITGYASNTDVGTGIAYVRGLADAASVCATPYLGTKEVLFAITKATPSIALASGATQVVMTSTHMAEAEVRAFIDNSDYGLADLDITSQVTIDYESTDPSVVLVNPTTGEVTAVGSGNAYVRVTVSGSDNWNSAVFLLPICVEVYGENAVINWANGDNTDETVLVGQ